MSDLRKIRVLYINATFLLSICRQIRYGRKLLTGQIYRQWHRSEFESGAGGIRPARSTKKFFSIMYLHFFGCKSTISRFGERFRDSQYSLSTFLFVVLLLTVPPCHAICKSGGHVPPCPMESAPMYICTASDIVVFFVVMMCIMMMCINLSSYGRPIA